MLTAILNSFLFFARAKVTLISKLRVQNAEI